MRTGARKERQTATPTVGFGRDRAARPLRMGLGAALYVRVVAARRRLEAFVRIDKVADPDGEPRLAYEPQFVVTCLPVVGGRQADLADFAEAARRGGGR